MPNPDPILKRVDKIHKENVKARREAFQGMLGMIGTLENGEILELLKEVKRTLRKRDIKLAWNLKDNSGFMRLKK